MTRNTSAHKRTSKSKGIKFDFIVGALVNNPDIPESRIVSKEYRVGVYVPTLKYKSPSYKGFIPFPNGTPVVWDRHVYPVLGGSKDSVVEDFRRILTANAEKGLLYSSGLKKQISPNEIYNYRIHSATIPENTYRHIIDRGLKNAIPIINATKTVIREYGGKQDDINFWTRLIEIKSIDIELAKTIHRMSANRSRR